MNIHERLEAFWRGEQPDQIPYTIYYWEWRNVKDHPAWDAMVADGLGVTYHLSAFEHQTTNVEYLEQDSTENGSHIHRKIRRTPVGEITAEWVDGWHHKYWLETPEDYHVMTWIAEHTSVLPGLERLDAEISDLPPFGVPLLSLGRTPLQIMLVDYAGLENFSTHLFDYKEDVHRLYKAIEKLFAQQVAITAQAPGTFVSNLENFTAESLGPRRYKEYLLPVYETYFPQLHAAGKIVGSHYDGRTASCKALIADSPIDLIESLTPPPEGDLTLAQAREVWPDKLFWSNLNVALYQLPAKELHDVVLARVQEAAPNGCKFAFEVSEHLPANWDISMPVVLKALKETRR